MGVGDHHIRKMLEERERAMLSPFASFSDASTGRERPELDCPIRTCFQRDRDRIIHSKAFRRLKHKTQVFLSPDGDHYRTRLTHTLEVSQVARTISRALNLNEDLTEAIALAHDLGHTPFGHAGERALSEISSLPFRHNENSLRVVDILENNGLGLNLCREVRDGILRHTGPQKPGTFEGMVVALADRIAYIHHDIDDAVRAGIFSEKDIPSPLRDVLGDVTHDRINNMILDVIENSGPRGDGFAVTMSPAIGAATNELRDFMFESIYKNSVAKSEESKSKLILEELYRYFYKHLELLPEMFLSLLSSSTPQRVLCDYISSMTDRYAVETFKKIYIPQSWHVL